MALELGNSLLAWLSFSQVTIRKEIAPLEVIAIRLAIIAGFTCFFHAGYRVAQKNWRHKDRLLVITLVIGFVTAVPTVYFANMYQFDISHVDYDPTDYSLFVFGSVSFASFLCAAGITIRTSLERYENRPDK